MDIWIDEHPPALLISKAMIEGFNRHYRLLRQYGHQAKTLFEEGDWKGVQDDVRARIPS